MQDEVSGDGRNRRPRSAFTTLTVFGLAIIAVVSVLFLPAIVISGEYEVLAFIGPPLVLSALFAYLVWRFGSWAFWLATLGGLVTLLFSLPSVGHALSYPDSFYDFFGLIGQAVGGLITVVAAGAGFFYERQPRSSPVIAASSLKRVMIATTAALGALAVVSGVLTLTGRETVGETERAGTTLVRMKSTAFEPSVLEVPASTRILVENHDPVVHTFTVKSGDATPINEGLTPGSERVVALAVLTPGEYALTCDVAGHEAMKGTLRIVP